MRISQLSTALPKDSFSTEELMEKFPCRLTEGVRQNILNLGVTKRCLVSDVRRSSKSEALMSEQGIVDLCKEACDKALEKDNVSTDDVDYFVVAYDVNPFLSPGLGQLLVPKLGLSPYVGHVNAQGTASTAFIKTLELARNHLAAHPKDTVLICVSGVTSYWFQNQVRGLTDVKEIDQIKELKERRTRESELRKWVATMQFFLFGDGAASAIVEKDEQGLLVKRITEVTNVGKKDYMAGYARLSALNEPFTFGFHSHLDKDIPRLGVKYTELALKKLFGENVDNMTKSVKKWAVHTGSEKILTALTEHHGIQPEKLKESHEILKTHGNLAGASLPFILEKIFDENKYSRGDMILMVGYGWGFSASACLLEFP